MFLNINPQAPSLHGIPRTTRVLDSKAKLKNNLYMVAFGSLFSTLGHEKLLISFAMRVVKPNIFLFLPKQIIFVNIDPQAPLFCGIPWNAGVLDTKAKL